MKILHLDIETSPNVAHVWGLFKQTVSLNQLMDTSYTMCFAAKWHGQDKIIFDSVKKSSEEKMVLRAWKLLNEADVVVHYNGARFDIPTLNKEFLSMGLPPPDPYHQIDLLRTVKGQFKFASNKLDHVVDKLGLGKKTSHAGHTLWVQCMAGDKKAWAKMEEYNKQDVLLLEKLYNKLLPWIKSHPNHALYADTERPVCTNCGSEHVVKKGFEHTKTMSYQRYRCSDCGTPLRGRYTVLDAEKKRNVLTRSGL